MQSTTLQLVLNWPFSCRADAQEVPGAHAAGDDVCDFGDVWAGVAAEAAAHPLAGTVFFDLFKDTGVHATLKVRESCNSYV